MDSLTRLMVGVVVVVHLMFFILEALFWMNPFIYTILLGFLNNPVDIAYPIQALTLRNLFINQGFYNLFLACAGVIGYQLTLKGKYETGYGLILFLCFAGVGAGVILAFSTKAYVLAVLQSVPAAVTFYRVYSMYKLLPSNKPSTISRN